MVFVYDYKDLVYMEILRKRLGKEIEWKIYQYIGHSCPGLFSNQCYKYNLDKKKKKNNKLNAFDEEKRKQRKTKRCAIIEISNNFVLS